MRISPVAAHRYLPHFIFNPHVFSNLLEMKKSLEIRDFKALFVELVSRRNSRFKKQFSKNRFSTPIFTGLAKRRKGSKLYVKQKGLPSVLYRQQAFSSALLTSTPNYFDMNKEYRWHFRGNPACFTSAGTQKYWIQEEGINRRKRIPSGAGTPPAHGREAEPDSYGYGRDHGRHGHLAKQHLHPSRLFAPGQW